MLKSKSVSFSKEYDGLQVDPIFRWAQLATRYPQLIDLAVYERLSPEHLDTLMAWENKQALEDRRIQKELEG